MADKLDGSAIIPNTIPSNRIQASSITQNQIQPALYTNIVQSTQPKIRSLTYPGNDTAANTGGGDTIVVNGTGFGNTGNVQIYINGNAVSSITVTNANSVSFTAPALSAATYPLYLINTSDGSTAILIPGIQYSGTPTWTTTTPLTTQQADTAWSIQLIATSDTAVSYSLQGGSSLPAGISLAANGLISGTMSSPPTDETTYNFTVIATDLENQDASRAFSVSVTVSVLDPFFTYTTLLLHGDGTNNANNHAFVDSSSNNFTITRNGNATQGTFSPFGDNWSNYFDGSGDYLNIASNAAFGFGTGDFTCECWLYLPVNASSGGNNIVDFRTSAGASAWTWFVKNTGSGNYMGAYTSFGATGVEAQVGYLQLNNWNHVAITRASGTWRIFVNGVSQTLTGSGYDGNLGSNNPLTIAATAGGTSTWSLYISNLRVIKGTALYTSAFTPPTQPLTPVSNTSLLTCQSNAFVDKGPNRFAITRNGDTRVSKFDPFKPYKAIPASYGVYFDGTGDYLTVPDDANWNLTSSTGSYELFVYPVAAPSNTPGLIGQCPTTANWGTYLYSDGRIGVGIQGTSELAAAAGSLTVGAWNHIVFTRDNSDSRTRIFVNGVLKATGTGTYFNDSSAALHIGHFNNYSFNGHISNVRVCKGSIPSSYITSNTTVGTTIFTTPTSALTAVANTVLLACQSTTIIDNSTNAYTITRNGDATPTELNPFGTTFVNEKYNTANGGGSLYSDGTDDYLTSSHPSMSGSWTIQFWWYPITVASQQTLVSFNNGGSSGINIWCNSSGLLVVDDGANPQTAFSGRSFVAHSWNHVAIVRNGSTTTAYINGILTGSNSFTPQTVGSISIGRYNSSPFYYASGYISNLRVVGSPLYSTNFLPPAEPVTNISNTSILLNFTNAGIIDSVGKNVLETLGDARVNTSVKKYGTGSMYFDGSGDYLKAVATVDNIAYGTGDFTVECWAYFVNAANLQKIFDNYNGNNNPNAALCISNPNANKIQWYSGQTKIVESTSSLSNNTWYHIAVSRTGSTTKLFINGNQEASASDSNSYAIGNGNISIGAEISTGLYSVNGYIDDLRITKGVARYRYNFTPPTKAFNDGDGNLANNTTDVLVGDQVNLPVFPYTTLLLHGDGTNNANNHAFLDSSNNAFAITRNGNATQGTFSPFSPTGWSYAGSTSTSYLQLASNTAIQLGTGDFTVECWAYFTTVGTSGGSENVIMDFRPTGTQGAYPSLSLSNQTIVVEVSGGARITTGTISLNQWVHIAWVRYNGNSKVYINGTQSGSTYADNNNYSCGSTNRIGNLSYFSGGDRTFNGYISNLRIVKGTAVYTAAFTPPTSALTAIANTSLLACQSNRFVDNSNNAFAITVNGTPSVQAFSPFAPSVEYTANTHGGSAYFDGTGDYLSVTNNVAFNLGTNSFCIDGWFYPTTTNATQLVFNKWGTASDAQSMFQIGRISSTFYAQLRTTSGYVTLSTATWIPNAWNHFAVVRSGSTISAYLNGARFGTDTSNPTLNSGTDTMTIGSKQAQDYFTGYIADCRIVNGSAIYDPTQTSITVPTAPTTAVTNTAFLSSSTNAGILDSTGKLIFETVGDVKVNTAIKKYGTGSMYFDGNGDTLLAPDSLSCAFGTGDFTIEFWAYSVDTGSLSSAILDTRGSVSSATGLFIAPDGTANYRIGYGQSPYTLLTVSGRINNQWQHVAFVRSGSTLMIFIDGNLCGSTSNSTNFTDQKLRISGYVDTQASPYAFNGYIDDLRITKGIARYVTNFTPPTAAFLNK